MTDLLDANVLIALAMETHVHHEHARRWVRTSPLPVATCPITQGALVRALVRAGIPATRTSEILVAITKNPRHEFWPDELEYRDVPMYGVIGHRQVTDAYLAALTRAREGRLITFDRGLAALYPDLTVLVPTTSQLPDQRNPE
jgi:toxin-antitoxin system PIN domain toxin